MQHEPHDRPTALVVDDSFAARARLTTLLQLGGWRVHQAVGAEHALRIAALLEPDLVVTEMVMRNGHGATLMRRLREQGSAARFLVVAGRRTQQCRALASAAGALACLAKPVDPRLFVDVLRGLSAAVTVGVPDEPAAMPVVETGELFVAALPRRLSGIALSAHAGDVAGVARAAESLAAATHRLGHAEIAFLSSSIARDAHRGTVSRGRLVALIELCARLDAALTAQAATSR
jgi:CheY-like chemotaxis protein